VFAVVFLIDEFKQQLSCMSCEIGFALKENSVVGWVEVDYEAIPFSARVLDSGLMVVWAFLDPGNAV
jgi:hypothetical protein